MGTAPVFASVSEAMDMVRAGLAFVAAADATELSTEEQAECLRNLERANSTASAARTRVLGTFTAGQGYSADADYSPRAWLMHKTRVTKVVAVAHTAWAGPQRAPPPPRVAVMAGRGWTGRAPAPSPATPRSPQ